MIDFQKIEGFDWDEGNQRKNQKHDVTQAESEQVFINKPLLILSDEKHSRNEPRYHALGKTSEGRLLHITFTLRGGDTRVRVISARDMHNKERRSYDQKIKTSA
ncbi:MAG: BrnT family toxin [Nitrospirae bacterium]|nr:BrnT family toxin [Nitrospirota bacterium]